MNWKQEAGRRLKVARIEAGLSQQEVADAVGKGSRTVSNWERGTTTPSEADYQLLSRILGTTPDALRPQNQGGISRPRVVTYYQMARTLDRVQEAPSGGPVLPHQVSRVVHGYTDRMIRQGCPESAVEEAYRLMTNAAFSQLHAHRKRPPTEEEMITDVHSMWRHIAESMAADGFSV